MKIQEYRKLDNEEKYALAQKCQADHMNVLGTYYSVCSFTASYIMGEKYYCKKHAANEALSILLEGSHEKKIDDDD